MEEEEEEEDEDEEEEEEAENVVWLLRNFSKISLQWSVFFALQMMRSE